MEAFRIEEVTLAVRDAMAHGALADAVKHLLLCQMSAGRRAFEHDDLPLSAQSCRRDHLGQGLSGSVHGSGVMTDTPQVLLAHHLKTLKLPTFLREYDKVARQCKRRASTIRVICCG